MFQFQCASQGSNLRPIFHNSARGPSQHVQKVGARLRHVMKTVKGVRVNQNTHFLTPSHAVSEKAMAQLEWAEKSRVRDSNNIK